MKLADLSFEMLSRAVEIYLSLAWPGREEEKRPELDNRAAGSGLLESFVDESKEEGGTVNHRYVKRLGNERYPHMKLVVEECLIPDEYFIAVDTHDELELKPDYPDYDAYGISVVSREQMTQLVRQVGSLSIVFFREQAWDHHHDVYGIAPIPGRVATDR